MVDFNNETTVTTPPGEVVKIVILERREQAIEALEGYYSIEKSAVDMQVKIGILRARVLAFWFQIEGIVERKLRLGEVEKELVTGEREKKLAYGDIESAMLTAGTTGSDDDKIAELINAYKWMNHFVDFLGLTYIDVRQKYKREIAEDANEKRGM